MKKKMKELAETIKEIGEAVIDYTHWEDFLTGCNVGAAFAVIAMGAGYAYAAARNKRTGA